MTIKEIVIANIDSFVISDFCPNGGWPKFDNLSVTIFNTEKYDDSVVYDLELLYDCEFPGCCFIPGGQNFSRLRKKVKISESSLEVLN